MKYILSAGLAGWLAYLAGYYLAAVGLVAAALFLLSTAEFGQRHRIRLHGSGLTRSFVEQHEAGHARVLAHLGVPHRVRVWPDRDHGGYEGLTSYRDADWDRLSRVEQIAVGVAGEVATGSTRGCASDQAQVRRIARNGREITQGYQLAKQVLR